MMNRNSVTTLVLALALGVLTASCAHDPGTSSGATATKKQSSTNQAPDVPLNQQGGY